MQGGEHLHTCQPVTFKTSKLACNLSINIVSLQNAYARPLLRSPRILDIGGCMDIINSYPQFVFETGEAHIWLPLDKIVLYNPKGLDTNLGRLSLLHEICHGLLEHRFYTFDAELYSMEQDAWIEAIELAPSFQIKPDYKIGRASCRERVSSPV